MFVIYSMDTELILSRPQNASFSRHGTETQATLRQTLQWESALRGWISVYTAPSTHTHTDPSWGRIEVGTTGVRSAAPQVFRFYCGIVRSWSGTNGECEGTGACHQIQFWWTSSAVDPKCGNRC